MAVSRPRRKPSFIWQPLLILFPVGVLASVGFFSLRQDKIVAQHDAVERARTIADSLLPGLWSAITNVAPSDYYAFQIDNAGELSIPPPLSLTPAPEPLSLDELTSQQAALWRQAQFQDMTNDIPGAILVIRDFLATTPPERFAGVGSYNLSSLLMQHGDLQNAAAVCSSILEKYPHAVCESGLPLNHLAEFRLLQISIATNPAPVEVSADDFCRHIIFDPSPLTSPFLSWVSAHAQALGLKDGNEHWRSVWQGQQECRELYESARSKLMTEPATRSSRERYSGPQIFWFYNNGTSYLGFRSDELPGETSPGSFGNNGQTKGKIDSKPTLIKNQLKAAEFSGPASNLKTAAMYPWILCRTESEISHSLFALLEATTQVPEYFGIAIEVAGKHLHEGAPNLNLWRQVGVFEGGGKEKKIYLPSSATNVLASASYSENGNEQFKVDVYLTSPATLFQRQSERTFWFGSLVAISALAAFIGLFSAWRAFNRQQELAEMKSNFVSSVSHELRAPIASVRLMAESLERGKVAEQPKQNEYFRFIGQECRRLSSLIENVLDFSRIEQGRKQYEFEPTDLLALVRQTVKLMESYGLERQVSLALKLPDHQPSTSDYQLSLDGRAIQQALINLLDNAIKHSPNGQKVSVVLECPDSVSSGHASRSTHHSSRITHHKPSILISVIDHGPGIPREEHEKIFERFYRLGSELRRETQGVGIGLSIVKHIVDAHGGRVLVESAPGKGSRFTIELPIGYPHKSHDET